MLSSGDATAAAATNATAPVAAADAAAAPAHEGAAAASSTAAAAVAAVPAAGSAAAAADAVAPAAPAAATAAIGGGGAPAATRVAAAGGAWATDHFSSPKVIENHWVIMEASNDVKRFVLVKRGGDFKFSKKVRCKVSALIGAAYGQVYEIRGGQPHPVDGPLLPLNVDDFITHGSIAAGHDNRDLVDDSTHQKLGTADIAELRAEGGGAAVIAALVSNSSTFKGKTEFSQAKYLKRKQQKYMLRFRVLECTPFTISRLMFDKHSTKIGNIRWDTVAQLLSFADVRAQANTVVCDELGGLLAGCATHRISGYGRVLHAAFGTPQCNMFEKFSFSKRIAASVVKVDLGDAPRVAELAAADGGDSRATGLVIACLKSDPWVYFSYATALLKLGSPFAVYHEYVEPLAALFSRLQDHGMGARLQLSDTWTREIVVAPDRTRPVMATSGHGGYILSGIYVAPEAARNHPRQDQQRQPRKRQRGRR